MTMTSAEASAEAAGSGTAGAERSEGLRFSRTTWGASFVSTRGRKEARLEVERNFFERRHVRGHVR
jgi:hypothetical protein